MNDATPPNDPRPSDFLDLLPLVERQARIAFRDRDPETREEAVAEAVAAAFQAFASLAARGIDAARRFPHALARFAVRHVQNGRHVGTRSGGHDVLCPRVQRRHGFRVERLGPTARPQEALYGEVRGQRELDAFEERLHDNTRTPVPDQAAFRIDFPEFPRSLGRRDRALLHYLSLGHSGKRAADKFQLSPGRVTQLRQQWCQEWHARHGELAPFERRRAPGASPA